MGETEGEITTADSRPSEEKEATIAQDSLQVPTQKKKKLKSPTPSSLRGRSATPVRGRSQTPFNLYMTRRSATPSTWRSITPFLKREEKEKTPFELGRDIKTQITCNKAVFDRALIMDISEPEELQKPVRYITSDMSVIDRAAVMDVSNVEVIYVVEEYEEYEEEEIIEEIKPKKKEKKPRKGRTPRKSMESDVSLSGTISDADFDASEFGADREDSIDLDEDYEESDKKKPKKKAISKKKKEEKKEKSPSPKLSLKLEIGGGQKGAKKLFEQQQQAGAGPKPPPKKSKLVLQMEEQARAAAKAAEEEAARVKPKGETFEEKQKRLQAEKEEMERLEAESRAQEEDDEEMPEEAEYGEEVNEVDDASYQPTEIGEDEAAEYKEEDEEEAAEALDEATNLPEKRRGSDSSDDFIRPDPYDEERWQRIAAEEGEEFMQHLRKYSLAQKRSEKERDADWQRRREQARLPHFINFLTDRTAEAGQSVRLACAVGGPDLSVKWFKDKRQLERDATHRIINNNNILALEVLNTTILDSGEYSCIVANGNDEVTSSCIVTIYEVFKDEPKPPSFRFIKDYYHLRDDELTIECHVYGVPRPIITWWRGAFEIKPSYKYTKLEEAHGVFKLLIYKPTSKDNGTYICKAINSQGEAQISHTVEVAKNRHFHARGIFHARDRFHRDKELAAKKAMDEALKSKAASDLKRSEEEPRTRATRASPEPIVPIKQKLSFATQLRDRMALEGTTLRFVCTVIGPQPTCRWMKDDKWVVVGPNIRNLSEEGKAILELIKVSAESSGVYKCIAKNDVSEIETSCYFKVYSAQTDGDEQEPIFALPLRDIYHSSQNDLIIDTKVRGNPRPIISWLKDDLPVVLDDRRVQIEHLDGVCELIINKPTTNDNGVYCCIAENKLGSQKISHTVVIEPIFTSRRSSVLSGVMSETDTTSPAKGKIEGILPPRDKNDENDSAGYERRSRLPDVSPKQQLYFVANLSNRYVAESSKVKLQAVIGGPDPIIKWMKDDQNVPYGPRIRNMNRDSLAVLEFLNVLPEDSGKYTCMAQNEFCKISSTAVLHVYQSQVNTDEPPVFVRPIKDHFHLTSNELILETGIRGQPTPEIQWFKDSIEIQNGGKFTIIQSPDGICELIIDYPDHKDSGKYVVKAENRAGKVEIVHNVLFQGKDSHIADNIHGVFHADKSLLRPKKIDDEKTKPISQVPAPKKDSLVETSEPEAESGKRRNSGRKSRKSGEDEEGYVSSATDYASDTGSMKEKKREKVIGIHFATSVRDRVVAEGSKVKISCFLEAKEPQVKWFKNGEPISNGPKIRGRYNEGLCLLEINSVTLEDSGEYRCWGRDETGEASTTCTLEVFADPGTGDTPPTFTRNIKDTLHGKLNELQLDVHVRGLPTPTITWVKDGVKIEPNEKYQVIEHDDGTCELFINNPSSQDSGKYVCQAENREGKTEIVHNVTLEPRSRRISPLKEGRPPAKPAGDGESTDAQMEIDSSKIRKKSKVDEEITSRREVPPPPDLKKHLYFRNFLSNRTVKSGSNVKWMVNIDGPEPVARWFHGDQPIAFGPKSKMSCQDGIAWLNLIGVSEEDSGEYTLKVKGPENEIVSTCTLFVYSIGVEEKIAPVFTVGIKDTYSLNENELVLDCRVRGKPKPEITWMKGTDLIVNDSKYRQMDEANGYSKLIISNPTVKDSGIYTCVARNEMSENKITHHVDFKGREHFTLEKAHGFFHRDPNKPHFLAPLGNQTVCQGGTVAITAEFMQSQSPIEVHWLRGRQCIHGQPNVKTFNDRGVYTLAILNAGPEVEGTYTCRASNAFGRIESHATVDVAVGFEKEERPPLFLSRPDTEMKIALGDPFSISFRIAGDPKPKLTFMKGTKDITKSDRISKEVSDDYTRFTVQKSQISDSGTYFVVARNSNGTDRIFVTVTVYRRARSETSSFPRWGQPLESFPEVSYFKDPPGPITTEPLMTDCGTSHLSLSWGKPQTNNSAPVIAYKVDVWTVGHEGGAYWKELGLTPINSFDAFGLKQNLEYHFRVTPRNRYGWGPSVQTTHPLQLGGAESLPEFVKILPGQLKVLLGSKFTLECSVRGVPEPRIAWFKDGMALKCTDSDRVTVKKVGSNCILSITNVIESDFGRYICEATNPKGRASTFARIQVITDQRLYEADNKLKKIINDDILNERTDCLPLFTMRLRDRRVQMTYPVRLTCRILGYPRPLVTWHKNDQIISPNDNYRITEEDQFYTLEIVSTKLDDSGVYTCTAKNIQGSISCHCSLLVDKGIRAYITPEFDVPLDPVYIFQERQDIRLTAKVAAYPSVAISWHCNGIKLRQSRRILATLDQFGYIELLVKNATIHDAGIYVCTASNAVGNIENCCRVQIEPNDEYYKMHAILPKLDQPYSKEPLFLVKPRSSDALEGDTVILFCEVVGDPKPDVVWLRDFLKPEYYKDEPHFRRIGDGPEYRLEIPDAKLDFTGTYSIIAKNCHGEAKAVISLQIYAKNILTDLPMEEKGTIRHGNVETFPRFIRHLKDMRCCDGDAIMMECEVEALPEPIVIWEKDGHVLPSGKDYIMHYDGTNATLSIPRVYPEDEGEYTCVAKNTLGRALSSACIIVDAPEEKETMLNSRLSHPSGNLSYFSTPRSTPIRCISPMFQHSNANVLTDRLNSSRNKTEQTLSPPKFISVPHNRVVEDGENVQFYCAVSGHPVPWCTWDKNGMIVTTTTRINVKEVKDLRVLHIEDVKFEDAGLYRITLENDYGRIEATARLDVICRSKHTKSPSNTTISRFSPKRNAYLNRRIMGPSTAIGGRLALAARYRGSSVPSVNIFHNSNELQETDRIKIDVTIDEIRLCINEVTLEDAGLYSCVLKWNQYETLVTSTIVEFRNEVEKNQRQKLQIKQSLPEKIEAKEYDTLDLCFELECPEDLPYIYQWSKNKQYINDCDEFNYIDHGNGIICLRLNDVTESGLYECKVSNLDASLHCSTFVQINVVRDTPSGVEIESAILKPLYPIIATVGSDVVFIGKVFPSNAEVDWFICGRKVPNSNNEAIIENRGTDSTSFDVQSCNFDGLRVLCIRNVNLIHSGEVKLSLFRRLQSSFSPVVCSHTSLIVYPKNIETLKISEIYTCDEQIQIRKYDSPAQIIKKPNNCTALIGSSIQLSITYKGYPTPSIKWFQRTRPIDSSANITIQNSEGISILTIKNITADDSGKYTVKVKNNLSMDEATASVAVEGPPEPPSGKPSVSVGPDRISIAWCGPAYDGGCMITGFIIEMESFLKTEENKDNIENWREIARVVDSLAYTVKNLKENYTYRFRVRAANIHGKSDPSLPSDCVDMCSKDPKRDNKTTLKITSCGDFKNRYEILEEIGKGRFGTVYKVQEKLEPYQILAAKVIKCIKSSDRQKVRDEISIMELLNHPKLLKLAAFFETPREITMLMEYITGGELFERVVADDFTLTELDCRLFIRQVCEGVGYMHDKCVVHLDLKPENIMCHTRTSHEIKIIDFGLAQRITTDASVRVLFGTPEFIAPEVINYEPIDLKSDMWSIGVICYVLLSGLSPFMGDNDIETFGNITNADYDFEDEAFDTVSQEAKDFISNLLIYNKTDRLSAQQCLQSKWLNAIHQTQNVFNNKICTDKLKKFIIRRKWQKTGNAIRALGRMVNLSASRRNSAISHNGSMTNSPRPSICGLNMSNLEIPLQMVSLNEEEDKFNQELSVSTNDTHKQEQKNMRIQGKFHCQDPNESVYSYSSNRNLECNLLSQGVKDTTQSVSLLSMAVSHDLLKTKLDAIAREDDSKVDLLVEKTSNEYLNHSDDNITFDATLFVDCPPHKKPTEVKYDSSQRRLFKSPTKESMMLPDFTQEIKMQKLSLEKNISDCNIKGKVQLSKKRFCNSLSLPSPKHASPKPLHKQSNLNILSKSKDCIDLCTYAAMDAIKKSNVNHGIKQCSSIYSTKTSKRGHTTTAGGLSEKVRETTARLSQQQTISSAKRNENSKLHRAITPSRKIPILTTSTTDKSQHQT